jgi:hypothetical protein
MTAAGARRFVVVRYLTEAADPEARARELVAAIDAAIDTAGAPSGDTAGAPSGAPSIESAGGAR